MYLRRDSDNGFLLYVYAKNISRVLAMSVSHLSNILKHESILNNIHKFNFSLPEDTVL
jgi:hypothetical protein